MKVTEFKLRKAAAGIALAAVVKKKALPKPKLTTPKKPARLKKVVKPRPLPRPGIRRPSTRPKKSASATIPKLLAGFYINPNADAMNSVINKLKITPTTQPKNAGQKYIAAQIRTTAQKGGATPATLKKVYGLYYAPSVAALSAIFADIVGKPVALNSAVQVKLLYATKELCAALIRKSTTLHKYSTDPKYAAEMAAYLIAGPAAKIKTAPIKTYLNAIKKKIAVPVAPAVDTDGNFLAPQAIKFADLKKGVVPVEDALTEAHELISAYLKTGKTTTKKPKRDKWGYRVGQYRAKLNAAASQLTKFKALIKDPTLLGLKYEEQARFYLLLLPKTYPVLALLNKANGAPEQLAKLQAQKLKKYGTKTLIQLSRTKNFTWTDRSEFRSLTRRIKILEDKIKAKDNTGFDIAAFKPKPWMMQYFDATTLSKLDGHFKVLTASNSKVGFADAVQAMSLKKARKNSVAMDWSKFKPSKEEIMKLDDTELLKIVQSGSHDKLYTTVFAAAAKSKDFKKRFLSTVIRDNFKLASPFGAINAKHLGHIVDLSNDGATALLSDADVAAWKPGTPLDGFISKHMPKEKIKCTKSDSPAATETAELRKFVAGVHNVQVTVLRAWNLGPKPDQIKLLQKNAKAAGWKVIPNMFHGTDTSAAGSILLSGFRLSLPAKTGRSMGTVLYMAPNVDKSAQYLGSNFSRNGTGIIFFGDGIVSGSPKSRIGTVGRGSSHSRTHVSDKDTGKVGAWTKSGHFKTEEIGLASPNKQFIIRKAYLIKTERNQTPKINGTLTKFHASLSCEDYLTKLGIGAPKTRVKRVVRAPKDATS